VKHCGFEGFNLNLHYLDDQTTAPPPQGKKTPFGDFGVWENHAHNTHTQKGVDKQRKRVYNRGKKYK